MNGAERGELERLRDAVSDLIGFGFEADRIDQLGVALWPRVQELGLSGFDAYISRLRAPEHRAAETTAVGSLLTVTETYFHRSYDQIVAFLDQIAEPAARSSRRLRILSAGCASGEEPYTLAIALRERFPDIERWDVEIVGFDLNALMLKKAEEGRYSAWSLRALPPELKKKYFRKVERSYELLPAARSMVKFLHQNLVEPGVWPFEGFEADAIFCRNVLMYFSPDVMKTVVTRLTSSLRKGGYLFLGHAEALRGITQDYQLCHTHETFYYQKRPSEQERTEGREESEQKDSTAAAPAASETISWFEAIHAASERVMALAKRGELEGAPPSSLFTATLGKEKLAEVLALMEKERFSEALRLMEALSPEAKEEPEALLLFAVLMTNRGNIEAAETACEKLLARDDLNAGAHYLKALCLEHSGDEEGAREHDSIAAHLDPTLAMPRLHAGLLAKRAGDLLTAQSELTRALGLLAREEPSRLVLFGGGFSRESLTSLCRTELARMGERFE